MHPVSSSNIRSIGYNEKNATLTVEFCNNSMYEYYCVPQYVFEAFLCSPSKGMFHAEHIKSKYNYRKVKRAQS